MSPFEKLQQDFPVWTIKNKRNYAIPIPTADGEEIQIQPFSTVDIPSVQLIQMPDVTKLNVVSPSLKTMMAYGLFAATPAAKADTASVPTPGAPDITSDNNEAE